MRARGITWACILCSPRAPLIRAVALEHKYFCANGACKLQRLVQRGPHRPLGADRLRPFAPQLLPDHEEYCCWRVVLRQHLPHAPYCDRSARHDGCGGIGPPPVLPASIIYPPVHCACKRRSRAPLRARVAAPDAGVSTAACASTGAPSATPTCFAWRSCRPFVRTAIAVAAAFRRGIWLLCWPRTFAAVGAAAAVSSAEGASVVPFVAPHASHAEVSPLRRLPHALHAPTAATAPACCPFSWLRLVWFFALETRKRPSRHVSVMVCSNWLGGAGRGPTAAPGVATPIAGWILLLFAGSCRRRTCSRWSAGCTPPATGASGTCALGSVLREDAVEYGVLLHHTSVLF